MEPIDQTIVMPNQPARRVMKGVYKITCKPTGHAYVGSSKDIHERWKAHRIHLRHGKHINQRMQKAFDLHGESSFEMTVVEECDPDIRVDVEQQWLYRLQPAFNGSVFVSPMAMAETLKRVRDQLTIWLI
jgi:group I intron endonuclease